MKFDDFVDALNDAGWRDDCDAQHAGASKLHAKIFPYSSELEAIISDLQDDNRELCAQLDAERSALSKLVKCVIQSGESHEIQHQ